MRKRELPGINFFPAIKVAHLLAKVCLYLSIASIDCEDDDTIKFDILTWWKVGEHRFSIVSTMARDLPTMTVSTVASEQAVNESG